MQVTRLSRCPRLRERFVQGLTLVIRQIIAFVVDDQVQLSAVWQRSRLIEVQPPILYTCAQWRH